MSLYVVPSALPGCGEPLTSVNGSTVWRWSVQAEEVAVPSSSFTTTFMMVIVPVVGGAGGLSLFVIVQVFTSPAASVMEPSTAQSPLIDMLYVELAVSDTVCAPIVDVVATPEVVIMPSTKSAKSEVVAVPPLSFTTTFSTVSVGSFALVMTHVSVAPAATATPVQVLLTCIHPAGIVSLTE